MHLVSIRDRPYAVINGKDYAVYRWFEPNRNGPLFLQVAGRTPLTADDLPHSDWIVKGGRDGSHRIATAWRHPWFDYRVDAARKLAFLGASSPGSLVLAFQYLARRFGLTVSTADLASRAAVIAESWDVPGRVLEQVRDQGQTTTSLVLLDLPSSFDADDASTLLAG
ncbi:MAG: hypothetical protein ABIT01_19335 [Thermoanaerobaculia bacterium]